jgi:GTP:adenosylcobinamide-phosphate guanylyltransferase
VFSEEAYVADLKRTVSQIMSPLLTLSLTDSVVTEPQIRRVFSNWQALVRPSPLARSVQPRRRV